MEQKFLLCVLRQQSVVNSMPVLACLGSMFAAGALSPGFEAACASMFHVILSMQFSDDFSS